MMLAELSDPKEHKKQRIHTWKVWLAHRVKYVFCQARLLNKVYAFD